VRPASADSTSIGTMRRAIVTAPTASQNVIRHATQPATTYAANTARCTPTLPGLTDSITAPRHNSMPCHSGVT
jgi:hypothetical protein